jgi:hypothetical protein
MQFTGIGPMIKGTKIFLACKEDPAACMMVFLGIDLYLTAIYCSAWYMNASSRVLTFVPPCAS